MILRLFIWLFKHNGWKIEGGIASDIKKYVLIAAPHTSNWDFVYSMAALKLFGISINFLAKKELFRWPLKKVFLNMGGIPVERTKNTRMVDATIKKFGERDELKLMISAEGSRKKVEKWKTGFYHVALGARVPVFMAYLDYERKVAGISDPFYPTGNRITDVAIIKTFYKNRKAKYPELFNLEAIRLDEK